MAEVTAPKRFRKLRIAWSVAWGVVAALLCVLWVRSYWIADTFGRRHAAFVVMWTSDRGALNYGRFVPSDPKHFTGLSDQWSYQRTSSSDANTRRFRFVIRRKAIFITLPIWLLGCLSTGAAWLPWMSWWRRFSLRTLLIATTLVAVVLGLTVWAARN